MFNTITSLEISLEDGDRQYFRNVSTYTQLYTASQPSFYTEDGSSMFLQNAGIYLPDYTAQYTFCYTEDDDRSSLMVGTSLSCYTTKHPSYYPEYEVAQSSVMLHFSNKLHHVTSQKTVICYVCFRVVLRHSWTFSKPCNQCSAKTRQEIDWLKTRTPAVEAPCMFGQMSAYVLHATKPDVCFYWTTWVDTHHIGQPVSVVTGLSDSRPSWDSQVNLTFTHANK